MCAIVLYHRRSASTCSFPFITASSHTFYSTQPPQVRFHLPVWLGVGDALNKMIAAGKLELLQVTGADC